MCWAGGWGWGWGRDDVYEANIVSGLVRSGGRDVEQWAGLGWLL